jgi:hypothetical protein
MSYYNLISTKNLEIHKRISFINDKQPDTSPLDTSPLDTSPLKSSCYISYSLYDYLSKFKKQIEVSLEAWDNIKKYTNPYEFIHTLIPGNKISVSKLKPLSRSFYKMIEIWKIFKLGEVKNCSYSPTQIRPIIPITTFHLAEGPGGFIEATSHIRKNTQDSYYGMTLLNDDPGCPGWKKSNTFLENNPNVTIIKGEDGTGDILKLENYKYCKNRFMNSMDIITADGGIDVSIDFNKQEKLVSKLIVAEIIYAVTMQKKGGHFILKIFDIFSKLTVDMLYLLSCLYSEVYVTKPHTSRLANSEKYIVCKNFLLEDSTNLYNVFCDQFTKIDTSFEIQSMLTHDHDYYFLNKIEEINVVLGQRQLENIITTLNMISNRNSYDKIDSMKKIHIQKCMSWCEKHDISYMKIFSSNNIFLSNVCNDGISISLLKSNNNSFIKGKSSNFINNVVYGGSGGGGGGSSGYGYNKNKPKIVIDTSQDILPETLSETLPEILAPLPICSDNDTNANTLSTNIFTDN